MESLDIDQRVKELQKCYEKANTKHAERNLKFYEPKNAKLFALAAFARSGSSLLGNIIENISGHFQGEDMPIETANESISKGNVRGTIEHVKIVKTHYPFIAKYPYRDEKLNTEIYKAAVLVRNPFKSIVSLFGLITTNSHTTNLDKSEYQTKSKDNFDTFVKCCAQGFNRFCEFWTQQAEKDEIPIIFITYEDLFDHQIEFGKDLFAFYEGVSKSKLSTVDKNTELVDLQNHANLDEKVESYFKANGLKSTYSDKQKSKEDQYSYYTQDQLKYIYETNKKWIDFFGYREEIIQNIGNIVEVGSDTSNVNGYLKQNEKLFEKIESYKLDKPLEIKNLDDEFEKNWVDPIIPMYNFTKW